MTAPSPRARAWLAAMCICLVVVAPAHAGTFLTNSDFDDGLAGWTVTGDGVVGWSMIDVADNEFSGSALLGNATPAGFQRVRPLVQCVQLTHTGRFRLQGDGRLPAGQIDAPLVLSYYVKTSPDCSGGAIAIGGRFLTRNDGWQHADIEFAITTAPTSVLIELGLDKDFAGGSASGWFDDVYFDVLPYTMRDGFENP